MPEVGEIRAFAFGLPSSAATSAIKNGWIPCDGRLLRSGKFTDLLSAISSNWGADSSSNRFAVPDLRGSFLRGLSYGDSKLDVDVKKRNEPRPELSSSGLSGANVGSFQPHAYERHGHRAAGRSIGGGAPENGYARTDAGGAPSDTFITVFDEGRSSETRPVNHSVLYMVYAGGRVKPNDLDDQVTMITQVAE